MSFSVRNIGEHIEHFWKKNWTILLWTNFQCTLMPVEGCNFAQLTAWAHRAMYFNCAALQAVHYYWNIKTYSVATPKLFLSFIITFIEHFT